MIMSLGAIVMGISFRRAGLIVTIFDLIDEYCVRHGISGNLDLPKSARYVYNT